MDIIIEECKKEYSEIIYLLNKNSLGFDFPKNKVEEKLQNILENKNYKVLVAKIDNKIIGYIQGNNYNSLYQEYLIDIMALVVDKDFQGKGVGRKLIGEIENWAKEKGAYGLRLVTRDSRKDAHEFYKKCGFKEIKMQKNFKKYFSK